MALCSCYTELFFMEWISSSEAFRRATNLVSIAHLKSCKAKLILVFQFIPKRYKGDASKLFYLLAIKKNENSPLHSTLFFLSFYTVCFIISFRSLSTALGGKLEQRRQYERNRVNQSSPVRDSRVSLWCGTLLAFCIKQNPLIPRMQVLTMRKES